MRRLCIVLILSLATVGIVPAQVPEVGAVLDRYKVFRPGKDDLAMYQIDWASSLEEAQKRALREKRPVFLVIIHAKYGNLSSGHC